MSEETASQSWEMEANAASGVVPGLVLVFSVAQSHLSATVVRREPLLVGRDSVVGVKLDDGRLSRRHAEVAFEAGHFRVRDVESRNGTFVDGERVAGERVVDAGVLRVGDTLLLLRQDVRPFLRGVIDRATGAVIGPTLRPVWQAIAEAAAGGHFLHVRGETGTGKELAARHFHESSGRGKRAFTAINCATIPPALAERLLFGARRGAFSGAEADADGYVQAASGGTLFLDEVAELDLAVQAKLLRVLEEHQVLALGATKPTAVDVCVCSATHRDLGEEVARGRFRQDLYYRLGLPAVHLPPLRARREDVPWLMQAIAAKEAGGSRCHASIVEAALTRPWPGNVRELEKRISEAARAAAAKGDKWIRAAYLSPLAGHSGPRDDGARSAVGTEDRGSDHVLDAPLSREAIERALAQTDGNVTAAAVALGLHRTQLRRLMVRLKIHRPQTDRRGT